MYGIGRIGRQQDAEYLVAPPFTGKLREPGGQFAASGKGGDVGWRPAVGCMETEKPEPSQEVFANAFLGVANKPDMALGEVVKGAEKNRKYRRRECMTGY